MKTRIACIDLAKGFTVFFMAPIHAMLLFGKPEVRDTVLGSVFRLIAEGTGAQLLMIIMGINFYRSTNMRFHVALRRAGLMLIAGYLLNAWKFVISTYLGIMPANFLLEMEASNNTEGLVKLFMTGDIFHFAGLAFLVLYLLSLITRNSIVFICFAAVICICSYFVFDVKFDQLIVHHLCQLLMGQPPTVFFPLVPWLVYPLVGFALGKFIKDGSGIGSFGLPGIVLMLVGSMMSQYLFPCHELSFYNSCAGHTIRSVGIAMAWLALWDMAASMVRSNILFDMLRYLGRNISLVYVIQWMLLAWLLPLIGYQTLDYLLTVYVVLAINVHVIGFVFIVKQLNPATRRFNV